MEMLVASLFQARLRNFASAKLLALPYGYLFRTPLFIKLELLESPLRTSHLHLRSLLTPALQYLRDKESKISLFSPNHLSLLLIPYF
jgi:hypothetical protein